MLCVEGTDGGESHEAGTLADHESMAVVAWGSGDDRGVSPPAARRLCLLYFFLNSSVNPLFTM